MNSENAFVFYILNKELENWNIGHNTANASAQKCKEGEKSAFIIEIRAVGDWEMVERKALKSQPIHACQWIA